MPHWVGPGRFSSPVNQQHHAQSTIHFITIISAATAAATTTTTTNSRKIHDASHFMLNVVSSALARGLLMPLPPLRPPLRRIHRRADRTSGTRKLERSPSSPTLLARGRAAWKLARSSLPSMHFAHLAIADEQKKVSDGHGLPLRLAGWLAGRMTGLLPECCLASFWFCGVLVFDEETRWIEGKYAGVNPDFA